MFGPLTSRSLRGKPRAVAALRWTRTAGRMLALLFKASQALSLAGPWQWLRGYWLAPVNITGCCMKCGQSFAVLTWCPHRCAPCGFTQPPLCLAPLRPCTRHQLALMPRPIQKLVLAMASPSPQDIEARRFAQCGTLAPPSHPSAPKGLPARRGITDHINKGSQHHARTKQSHHLGAAARVRALV